MDLTQMPMGLKNVISPMSFSAALPVMGWGRRRPSTIGWQHTALKLSKGRPFTFVTNFAPSQNALTMVPMSFWLRAAYSSASACRLHLAASLPKRPGQD